MASICVFKSKLYPILSSIADDKMKLSISHGLYKPLKGIDYTKIEKIPSFYQNIAKYV